VEKKKKHRKVKIWFRGKGTVNAGGGEGEVKEGTSEGHKNHPKKKKRGADHGPGTLVKNKKRILRRGRALRCKKHSGEGKR